MLSTNTYPCPYDEFRLISLNVSICEIIRADASFWMNRGMSDLRRRLRALENPIVGQAKNIVFFLGDGMSLATVTAARVHMEQTSSKVFPDGNASLTFEKFPYTGLVRVRCVCMSDILHILIVYFCCIRSAIYMCRRIVSTNKWLILLVRQRRI